MKLWVDDVRPVPRGYNGVWCKSVNEAKDFIQKWEKHSKIWENVSGLTQECIKRKTTLLIDLDHDAGDYVSEGGDYIKLLDWLEETGRNYPIRIHSMNPVGVENMRRIIQRNNWTEVK